MVWEQLVGSPRRQVINSQMTVPTSAASTICSVTKLLATMPLPMVVATDSLTIAPARLRTAASTTAVGMASARVSTLVAMALAASWKPVMKLNVNAPRIMSAIGTLGILSNHCLD